MNFTIEELTRSTTALNHGINNDPPEQLRANGERLLILLQEVRELLGVPMDVTSGYRSKRVNALVRGERKSLHLEFLACDFKPRGMGLLDAFNKIKGSNIQYDQLILEPSWLHIQLPRPRRMNLIATKTDGNFTYRKVD